MQLMLTKFTLYETSSRLLLVGSNQDETEFQLLKIAKNGLPPVEVQDDGVVYSGGEMFALLQRVSHGNASTGGLTLVTRCYGIIGLVRFLKGYYLILITKRSVVATLGGHFIYHIDDTLMVSLQPSKQSSYSLSALSKFLRKGDNIEQKSSEKVDHELPNQSAVSDADETHYLSMFQLVQLSKNFYFSYSYNLTQTLQQNLTGHCAMETRFVWNAFLLSPLSGLLSGSWAVPIVYGVVDQSKMSVLGGKATYYLTLIGRRSRYMAGTRYLKRGIDACGNVANEIETEQIVHDAMATSFNVYGVHGGPLRPHFTSFVQHRGSIPLFWGQEMSGIAPKPAISIQIVDPFFVATRRHFEQLCQRYASPVIALDLVKQNEKVPRESILLKEYDQAIRFLNSTNPGNPAIEHVAWDMAFASKSSSENVLETLAVMAEEMVEKLGIFFSGNPSKRVQRGIVRSNCIDCLDRTNAAQFMIGKVALAHQLFSLGAITKRKLPLNCDAVALCKSMFQDHGDTIALQYGGSNLVNTMETYAKNPHWTSHSRDMIESVRRYYNNSFTDADKQDSISLFLGHFVPHQNTKIRQWDLPPADRFANKVDHSLLPYSFYPYTSLKEVDLSSVESLPFQFPKVHMDCFSNAYRPNQYTPFSDLFTCNILTNLRSNPKGTSSTALPPATFGNESCPPSNLRGESQESAANSPLECEDAEFVRITQRLNAMLSFSAWNSKQYLHYSELPKMAQQQANFKSDDTAKLASAHGLYVSYPNTVMSSPTFSSSTALSMSNLTYLTYTSQSSPDYWHTSLSHQSKPKRPDYVSWLDTSQICD